MKNVYLAVMCAAWLTVGDSGLQADDNAKPQPTNAGQVATAANATDVAFDRYVDLDVLATAWDSLNSELLTDVALQMLEGERVLRRSHHAMSADQLLSTAVKVAIEKQDTASLARLAQASEASGRSKLTEEIRIAEKLLANSRGDGRTKDAATAEMSADQLEMQRSVLAEIRRAKLVGDPDTLNAIEKDLAAASALTEQQRKQLLQQINEAKSSTSPADASQQAARETLDKLSGESRQWNVPYPPPYYPPYYPQNNQIWYRNPYDPGANIAIPGTNRYFSRYVPGVGWVQGNQYIGLDGMPHGSTTTTDPYGGGSTSTFYYKKK